MTNRGSRGAASSALDRVAAVSWRLLVVAAAVAVVGWILVRLRLAVVPVIAALFLVALLTRPVDWLRRRGWPSMLATLTVLLVVLALLAGIGFLVGLRLGAQLAELGGAFQELAGRSRDWLTRDLGVPAGQIDQVLERTGEQLRTNWRAVAGGVLAGAVTFVQVTAGLLLTVVLVFFFLKDGPQIQGWLLRHVPEHRRDQTRDAAAAAWTTLSRYIAGVATIALVDAVLIGLVLLLIGVPAVLPLAILVFLGGFIPLVGPVVTGFLAALVALASGGVVDALLVVAAVVGVNQLEGNVLQPVVMRQAVRLHPVVVLLAITAGAVLWGVTGAFLSVPVTAVAAAVGSELRSGGGDGR